MRILVVEDQLRLAEVLERGLRDAGHDVDVRHSGPDGLLAGSSEPYDAIVLDWMLPGQDGPSVCRGLRARGIRTPVLMLTARTAIRDRVAGQDSGADDYLAKPFNFDELLARLRAFGRRRDGQPILTAGDLIIDRDKRTVTRGNHPVELTTREFDILALLAETPGKVVTRYDILDNVWDGETDLRDNVISVHLANLRAKIDRPFDRVSIQTLRGAGYRLIDDRP